MFVLREVTLISMDTGFRRATVIDRDASHTCVQQFQNVKAKHTIPPPPAGSTEARPVVLEDDEPLFQDWPLSQDLFLQ
jgi:hypothetical protein